VSAKSSVSLARIGGAFVSITAAHWSVGASSSLTIARVSGAFVVVIANYLVNNALSSDRVAIRWEAQISTLANLWSEDASSCCIARVISACIGVVAENRRLDDVSSGEVARIFVASVILLESLVVILWSVDASNCCIASVGGASVVVSARDCNVSALSRSMVA